MYQSLIMLLLLSFAMISLVTGAPPLDGGDLSSLLSDLNANSNQEQQRDTPAPPAQPPTNNQGQGNFPPPFPPQIPPPGWNPNTLPPVWNPNMPLKQDVAMK